LGASTEEGLVFSKLQPGLDFSKREFFLGKFKEEQYLYNPKLVDWKKYEKNKEPVPLLALRSSP
jgi:hypothetical protein